MPQTAPPSSDNRPERKNPPHFRPVERHNQPVILYVTICVTPRVNALANSDSHEAFLRAAADADAWSMGYYLLMPDHIHLFCTPARTPPVTIKRWMKYLKERFTKIYGQHSWKWLPDCWDRQVRSSDHYHEKWEYTRLNPVRAGLVGNAKEWPYQGQLNELRW